MTQFVVDASVALSWCFEDEMDRYTTSVLEAFRSWQGVVPALWPFEVANGLASAERRRRIRDSQADEFLRLVLDLPIRIDAEPDSRAILQFARRSKLSAYDAAYLELAARLGLPLATLDRQLRNAAQMMGVEIFQSR